MICGTIVAKGCNVEQSVIQLCYQSSVCRETGETRSPSINVKLLSTMIAHVMKHVFLDKDIPAKME